MPNHFHAIVHIRRGERRSPDVDRDVTGGQAPLAPTMKPRSIGSLVAGFKSAVTKRINERCTNKNSVWQRNYYEHIIRDEEDYFRIVQYIRNNPAKWAVDSSNS
jgi:putative transposase